MKLAPKAIPNLELIFLISLYFFLESVGTIKNDPL